MKSLEIVFLLFLLSNFNHIHSNEMQSARTTASTPLSPKDKHPDDFSDQRSLDEKQQNPYRDVEYAILICIGTVGVIGNVGIMTIILLIKSLRKSSNAFMFHHCVLDLLKALYCGVFANSIYTETAPKFCNLLGGSFIVCVTSTAFNNLAMVMNEAYVFADLNAGVKDSGNYCCVMFSISTIWFASIILNLGVAFLPGNPSFIPNVGHCTFEYGEIRNYVLHILWIILVTFAVGLTSMYLKKLYSDICDNQYTCLTKVVRASISLAPEQSLDAPIDDEAEQAILKKIERYSLRKFYTLMFMTLDFIIHYYPLFMLTLIDQYFKAPPTAYKVLTIFACSNAAVNPFVFISLIKRRCCCQYELPTLPLACGDKTNCAPTPAARVDDILHSSTRYSRYLASDDTASGIYNDFYQRSGMDSYFTSQDHSPSPPHLTHVCDHQQPHETSHNVTFSRPMWAPDEATTSTL